MSSFYKFISVFALSSILLTGCGAAPQATTNPEVKSDHKLKIVTTFYPMYDFTRNVAGNNADVVSLVPAGTEPHDWEPTAKDMQNIQQADVFVYNGAGFEKWVEKVLASVGNTKMKTIEASKGITLLDGAGQEGADPHVWLDPNLAGQEVRNIENLLEQADPAHKDDYQKNAEAYIAKLQELDKLYQETVNGAKQKEFVTQHASFGYLAKRYGLQQIAISGLSPEQEPSMAKLAEIAKIAKQHQVKVIYFETLTTPKVAQILANEIGAKTSTLNPIEGLTEEEKAKNLDYIAVMKVNLEELKKSFE